MELLCIYNAKSDRFNALFDFAHKIVSPSTYACDLCKLTHSNFGERAAWKAFTETSNIPLTFYHLDEFERQYSETFTYPVILKKEANTLAVLLNTEAIARFKTTEELIEGIQELVDG